MKQKKTLFACSIIFLISIFVTGCSTTQTARRVDIDKSSFDIQNNPNYPISNIEIVQENGELLLKGSVSRRT